MKLVRKIVCMVMALTLLVSMATLSGCSTPANAMTVDGKTYSTGEYLANLYNNFYSVYYSGGLYYYSYYGMDPWEQEMTYGDGDDAVSLSTADYIIQLTKDAIVRQKAVENLMEKYGIAVSDEDIETLDSNMDTISESDLLTYGFNKEHYRAMYLAANLEEQNLFYGLYDEGGERAVSEEDIRDYFDNNFVSYKSIEISLVDDNGDELSDADKEAVMQTLQTYLDMYNSTLDFDAVIAQYEADTAEEEETDEDTDEGTDEDTTEDADDTETTTEADTDSTTTAEDETTTEAETTTTTEAAADEEDTDADETDEDDEDDTDDNLNQVNSVSGDEAIVEAVLKVAENSAQIVEYTPTSGSLTAALILRLNNEEVGGDTYYDDQRTTILYGMKYDEFNEEVEAEIATLEVTYNNRAISMCDPRKFIDE